MRGTDRDAGAAKLGVEFIVNGSVQSGDKGLHVTVHLDHVLTHATVWTASYDQKGLAASEFQSQIAAATAGVAHSAIHARRDDPAEMDDAALGLLLKKHATAWTLTPASFLEQRDLRSRNHCPRSQIRRGLFRPVANVQRDDEIRFP